MFDLNNFKEEYIDYLNTNLVKTKLDKAILLSMPFYDRFNDALEVYIEESPVNSSKFIVSDNSYILINLEMTGLTITPNRMKVIKNICKVQGVKIINNELVIESNKDDLPRKVHQLVQAMLRVDDMHLTSQSRVASYFLEDVKSYFNNNEIFYSENIAFVGRAGLTHTFDFLFQKNKTHNTRICKTVNHGNISNMKNILFAWQDIMYIDEEDSTNAKDLIVILNDSNNINKEVITGFSEYGVTSILWSEREQSLDFFR